MADETKQKVDIAYKLLASIATGGAILGSVATTYWVTKNTSFETRALVQDATLLVRESSASNQAALTSFVANTEKHLGILYVKTKQADADTLRLRDDLIVIDGRVYDLAKKEDAAAKQKP